MRPAVYHRPMTTRPPSADVPRLTVALTFDHDAISDSVRRGDPPVKLSHGEFGPRVGAPRILALLARRGIASTWFVPGHTLETFPESTAAIVAGGHELASHGWYHEDFSELTDRRAAGDPFALLRGAGARRRASHRRAGGRRTGRSGSGPSSSSRPPDSAMTRRSWPMTTRSTACATATATRPPMARAGARRAASSRYRSTGRLDDWPHFEPASASGRDGLAAAVEGPRDLDRGAATTPGSTRQAGC